MRPQPIFYLTPVRCAYTLANILGHGFIEKIYENALNHELSKNGLRVKQFPSICHRWIQMHTDAVAGIVVTYTYRDRIGLVQALACHPLPRMCSLSQGLLFKWRTELINEQTPIERRPLLRSPAQYFNRYSISIYLPRE
ncbi:MAG: hypothetical protein ISS70_12510 [Phycisphaerae bacterium]|nr:hypothetical protein [Phycisphaerae bacterium]